MFKIPRELVSVKPQPRNDVQNEGTSLQKNKDEGCSRLPKIVRLKELVHKVQNAGKMFKYRKLVCRKFRTMDAQDSEETSEYMSYARQF